MEFNIALSVLVTTFLGLLGLLIRHLIHQRFYWSRRGIPSLSAFPIIGVFSSVAFGRKSSAQLSQDLYRSCPGASYYGTVNLNRPLLVVKDPEIVREIGVKSFEHFPNHRGFIEEDFDPLLSRNVFSLKNERWRDMRATLSPTFTGMKMRYMFDLVSKCSSNFVRHLGDQPNRLREIDAEDAYTRYAIDVIATVAFGVSVDSMKEPNNEFYRCGTEAVNTDGWLKRLKFIAARIFPRTMRFVGQRYLSKKTNEFFRNLVTDGVRMRRETGISRPDMISLLMEAKMTVDDMIAQAFIFFLAGFGTSTRLMCFASNLLAHHPDVQEKLRREVDDALGDEKGEVTWETLAEMRYMDMVIWECLRLYPPTPFTDRVCRKTYTLPSPMEGFRDVTVEPDTSLWIPTYGFHRDPKYFDEPDRFDPERFSEDNRKKIVPYTFMPFGLGPRKCIGERFALMETKILMADMLRNFVIKPSEKTGKVVTFSNESFLVGSAEGFWIKLERRQ